MTKDEFYSLYTDKFIRCYIMEELTSIIRTYCVNNIDTWEHQNLSNPDFIISNKYNIVGIIIYVDKDRCIYHGIYDSEVKEFIEAKEILKIENKNEETTMNEITRILEKIYVNEDLRSTIVPLFMSDPGMGN